MGFVWVHAASVSDGFHAVAFSLFCNHRSGLVILRGQNLRCDAGFEVQVDVMLMACWGMSTGRC